jgi:uncharacterized membrane protein YeaQ/YmgE (transglycosylase-associated protein family)
VPVLASLNIIPPPAAFEGWLDPVLSDAKCGRPDFVPDIVNLIIWLVAGVAGGNAAGELVKEDYDLGPGNTIARAIGGVVGTLILQTPIPALRASTTAPSSARCY